MLVRNLKHHLVMATKQNNADVIRAALENYERSDPSTNDAPEVKNAKKKIYILEMKESKVKLFTSMTSRVASKSRDNVCL